MTYDENYRKKVITFIASGHTRQEAAKKFNISFNTACAWWQRYRETGSIAPPAKKPQKYQRIDPLVLKANAVAYPQASLNELAASFGCSAAGVSRALKRQGITRKSHRIKLEAKPLSDYILKHPHATNEEISEAFGCHESTVRSARKRFGIAVN